jgi:predicted XRE-type DNA-binding protein
LSAFDPRRHAILLVTGDKSGSSWDRWYRTNIPVADQRYARHLTGLGEQREDCAMVRSWRDVKADKARRDAARGHDMGTARTEARTRTQAYILGFRLAQLREEIGMSQAQLAENMGISQPRVSQIERGDVSQIEVDTLSRYIMALGGRLKLVADFEDHEVTVSSSEVDRSVALT